MAQPIEVSENRGSVYASYYQQAGRSMDIGDAARMDPQEAILAAVKQNIFRVLGRSSPEKQLELLEWLKQCEGSEGGPLKDLAEIRHERLSSQLEDIKKIEAEMKVIQEKIDAAKSLLEDGAATLALAASLAALGTSLVLTGAILCKTGIGAIKGVIIMKIGAGMLVAGAVMAAAAGVTIAVGKENLKTAGGEMSQLVAAKESMMSSMAAESRTDASVMGERAGTTLLAGQSQANDVASLKDLIFSFMGQNPFGR